MVGSARLSGTRLASGQPAQGGRRCRVAGQGYRYRTGRTGIGNRLVLDLGFVDHRAAQEAAAVVSVGLDHFQRKAHRLRLAIHSHTGELKQQPVGVVELCAVVGAAVELLDVGRPKIICFNRRP